MQKEKIAFEFAFVQSQINPHFLYNTLNVVFAQALKISPQLALNISKMSEIIRYSMENVGLNIPMVSVEKELEQLKLLIEINALRFGQPYYINFHIEGQSSNQLIPPLSFITVVENAFKYGDIRDSKYPVTIKVKLWHDRISFSCKNKKKQLNNPLPSTNIGIKNLRYRLHAAFKDRFQIQCCNEDCFYTLELIIKPTYT